MLCSMDLPMFVSDENSNTHKWTQKISTTCNCLCYFYLKREIKSNIISMLWVNLINSHRFILTRKLPTLHVVIYYLRAFK